MFNFYLHMNFVYAKYMVSLENADLFVRFKWSLL